MLEEIEYFKACANLVNKIPKDFSSKKIQEFIKDVLGYDFVLYYSCNALQIYIDDEMETPVLAIIKDEENIVNTSEICYNYKWDYPSITIGGSQCNPVKGIIHNLNSSYECIEFEDDFNNKLFNGTLTEEEYFQYSTVLNLNNLEYYLQWNEATKNIKIDKNMVLHWYYGDFISKEAIDELSKRI